VHITTVFFAPLQWIKNTMRGAVTSWLLEETAELDYRVVYLPGPQNKEADAMSRAPIVAPSTFNTQGMLEAWDTLLGVLQPSAKKAKNVFVWAGPHTTNVANAVQSWRTPTNALKKGAPKTLAKAGKIDLLLVAPNAEDSPIVAHQVAKERSGGLRACLVQSDLVRYVACPEGKVDRDVQRQVERASKITFLDANQTWLIFDDKKRSKIIAVERATADGTVEDWLPPTTSLWSTQATEQLEVEEASDVGEVEEKEPTATSPDAKLWQKEAAAERKILQKYYKGRITTEDGGPITISEGEESRIYVPTTRRKQLVMAEHSKRHSAMTYDQLRRIYIWPGMHGDCKKWQKECKCALAKAKISRRHGQFRVTDYHKPRTAYGIDYYSVAKSAMGHVGVITIVDLFTRYVMYIPVQDLTAETAAKAILENVVYKRGAFKTLVSDAARAFTGKIVSGLCAVLGVDQVTTQYYPQGNALTERNHVVLGEFLRMLPKDSRQHWEREIRKLEYGVNMTVNSATGYAPFELECGFIPNSPGDLKFIKTPSAEEINMAEWGNKGTLYQGIIENVQKYHELAQRLATESKWEENDRLNKSSGPRREFAVGDNVIVYVPQKPEEEWMSKHSLQWKYGIVKERRGATTYVVEERDGSGVYNRHVSLVQPDHSPHKDVPKKEQKRQKNDDDWKVMDIIAVVEDYDHNTYEVAQILSFVEDDEVEVRFYGTISDIPTKEAAGRVQIKPVWIDAKGVAALRKTAKSDTQWTGTLRKEDIICKVKLTKNANLNAESAKKLSNRWLKSLTGGGYGEDNE